MGQWLLNAALVSALQLPFLLALALHYDVFGRHNFLLGSAYALALCVFIATFQPLGLILAIVASLLLILVVLVGAEVLLFAPLERASRSPDEILIATLGANIIGEQALSAIFGDQIQFPPANSSAVQFFADLPFWLTSIPIGLATAGVLVVTLNRTEVGARLIALGEDRRLFRALGFRPVVWQIVALGLIGLVLTSSSVAAANVTGGFPTAGFSLVILGFVTRLLGGPAHRPKFFIVAAAVLLGDQAVAVVLPGQWRTLVLFAALLLLILARSRGMRGAD